MFEAMVIIVFVKDERISWGDCLSFLKNIKFKEYVDLKRFPKLIPYLKSKPVVIVELYKL
jgi:hypothetical protein